MTSCVFLFFGKSLWPLFWGCKVIYKFEKRNQDLATYIQIVVERIFLILFSCFHLKGVVNYVPPDLHAATNLFPQSLKTNIKTYKQGVS